MAPVRKVLDALRESLWFVPALWVVVCAAAALGLVTLERGAAPAPRSQMPLIFSGGPEGARGLLSAIASSMITVVGVVFSITIVALQLASAQYSPRVLRNFMRDRASQMTLGSLIGTFVYALLVLRVVRTADETRDEFVPFAAVTGAVALAIVAVGLVVYFIHHIATRMQVSHIAATVAHETLEEIDRQSAGDGATQPQLSQTPPEPGHVVPATRSGYLQYVELQGLQELAEGEDITVQFEVAPGGWVQRHAPLFRVWGRGQLDDLAGKLHEHVSVGDNRVLYQDAEFGIQQLVDIGVKALSPGINDPTTARNVLHRLVEILVAAGRADLAPRQYHDAKGALRLQVAQPDFASLLRTAFEEIHHFGRDIPSVARTLTQSLDTIEAGIGERHRPAIGELRAALALSLAARTDTR